MQGQFIWYELTTPDIDGAKKFYPKFTAWGTQAFDKDYTMWTSGGVPIAGLFRLNDDMKKQGVPPNWMPYIESTNVDDTVAKASSLGAKVMVPPADIPNTGRFAVLADPQGAVFGVYKSSQGQSGWDGTAVVGRFSWHELMTTDRVAALKFYSSLFGWDKNGEMDMGGGEMYVMYGHGQKMYGGIFNRMPDMASVPPFWLLYINVKDVGKAVAAATKAGGKVVRPQMDIPGGSIAILADPQGAGIAVHHNNPAPAPAAVAKPAAKAAKPAARKVAKTITKRAAAKKAPAKKAAAKKAASSKPSVKRAAAKPTVKRAAAKPMVKRAAAKPKAKKAARPVAKKSVAKSRRTVKAKGRRR